MDEYRILDILSELIYVIDEETHDILYINQFGKNIFGDCIGKKCHYVFQGSDKPCECCLPEDLNENECYIWKILSETKEKLYMLRDKSITWRGKPARMKIGFDITENERVKKELNDRLNIERFIIECITEIHKNESFDKIMESLLRKIGEFLESDRVYLFDFKGDTAKNTYEWCKSGIESQKENLQNVNLQVMNRWIEIFKSGNCVIIEDINDIKNSQSEYELLTMQNIQSLVAAPLENNGGFIGFIGVDNIPNEKINRSEAIFAALSYFVSSVIVKKDNESKLNELSFYDSLTGLYNRNKFMLDTDNEDIISDIGVIYTDLNGLKEINDKGGHAAGDRTLKEFADIIINMFGGFSSYRIGGDEFVIVCKQITEEEFSDKISAFRERISPLIYSAAVGSYYSEGNENISEIIKKADKKMYQDKKSFYKESKSGRYNFYGNELSEFSTAKVIKNLIEEERFVIWFQPRFSVENGELSGAEALIRYFDENDIILSPIEFIPEMEKNKTIHLIDFYVFRHVCEYISGWINKGKKVKPISMNMSQETLRIPNFIENLMNIWYDFNIPKDSIIIEISEDSEKNGISDIIEVISKLKNNGFKIAIDNFGSKYLDLYLFSEVKFDILKLDKSFLSKIEEENKAQLLTNFITDICHNENIKIIADGIENEKQLQTLKDIKCDEVQGFLLDKPMSWNWFEEKYL